MSNSYQKDFAEAGQAGWLVEELVHIGAAPAFRRSPVMSRLLTYLVEHRLSGQALPPKAYAVAVEALGKPRDFDPQTDSYPRVMVGRLRTMLDVYYAKNPSSHRLTIPLGQYNVVLAGGAEDCPADSGSIPDVEIAERTQGWRWIAAGLGLSLAVALTLIVAMLPGEAPTPDMLVAPPSLSISAPRTGGTASIRIAREVEGRWRDGFRRFGSLRLRSEGESGVPQDASDTDYRLDSAIAVEADGSHSITVMLNRMSDRQTIWSDHGSLQRGVGSDPGFADAVVARIGRDYGVLVLDRLSLHPDDFSPGYPCLSQQNRFRYVRDQKLGQHVEDCLAQSLVLAPKNPELLDAMSATLLVQFQTDHDKRLLGKARAYAEQAFAASPMSSKAVFAMARSEFFAGECDKGRRIGIVAAKLNPYDPDLLGAFGAYLMECDDPLGPVYARRTIALDPQRATFARVTLALHEVRSNRPQEALALLNAAAPLARQQPQVDLVRALALAQTGRQDEAQRLWHGLARRYGASPLAPSRKLLEKFIFSSKFADAAEPLTQKYLVASQ